MPKKRKAARKKPGGQKANRNRQNPSHGAEYLAELRELEDEHAQLVQGRHLDPGYAQHVDTEDGRRTFVPALLPEPEDVDVPAVLTRQHAAFNAEFGREPSPGDPVFFNAPVRKMRGSGPSEPEGWTENQLLAELSRPGMAEELGMEPAFLAAMIEMGYAVSDQNRHLHSAADVVAFEEALTRHRASGEAT